MTKKMNWKVAGAAAVLVAVAGGLFALYRSGAFSPSQKPDYRGYSASNITEANNLFAFEFYSAIKGEEGNVFFSPFSITSAFAMVYDGARGQTADELSSVFHLPEDVNTVREEYASIYGEINAKDRKYELKTANAFWAQEDYPFLSDYLSAVKHYYGGEIRNLDFGGNPTGSAGTINNWVEEKTNGKIKDLIPASAISGDTKAILTNAIYFKGEWVKQFDESETEKEKFKTDKSGTVVADMMRRTDNKSVFGYMENQELQALEMPYAGDDLSALFLLPKSGSADKLAEGMDAKALSELAAEIEEQRVDVYVPRFKFETEYTMSGILKNMGLTAPFSDAADFSGITGKQDLKIDEAIHKAYVEVNEEGTEAAAATGIVVGITSTMPKEEPKIPEFRADHPFLFIIQHKATGMVLFMGRVSNPNL
jgi:serpin B